MKSTKSNWDIWPKWSGPGSFKTPQFQFCCSVTEYTDKSDSSHIAILKDRKFIEIYRKLTQVQAIENILEVGFFQGGMPLFLADMVAPKKNCRNRSDSSFRKTEILLSREANLKRPSN